MPTPLRVTHDSKGEWVILRAEGEIDIASVEVLGKEVERALDEGARAIAFDLSEISFMDSTGLRLVLETRSRLKERDGEVVIVTGSGPVRRLLQMTGVDATLPPYGSLDEALTN